jgi:peptidoglycan/LPS O-acetylase OafA/YrhL
MLIWAASIGFFWFHIFIDSPFKKTLTYRTFERDLYALSIAWIVFACHTLKSGGLVRSFLSSTAWQPLSKLCLNMYLLHYCYILTTLRYYKTSFGFLWILQIMISDVVLCMVASAVAYVLVELPAAKIIDFAWSFNPYTLKGRIDREQLSPLLVK